MTVKQTDHANMQYPKSDITVNQSRPATNQEQLKVESDPHHPAYRFRIAHT